MQHMGFRGAQASIERKEGVSAKSAGAILGAAAKKTSAAGIRKNPRIKRVLNAQKGKSRMMQMSEAMSR